MNIVRLLNWYNREHKIQSTFEGNFLKLRDKYLAIAVEPVFILEKKTLTLSLDIKIAFP